MLKYFEELQCNFIDNYTHLETISNSWNKLNTLAGPHASHNKAFKRTDTNWTTNQNERNANSKITKAIQKLKDRVSGYTQELSKLKESIDRKIEVCAFLATKKIREFDDAKQNKILSKEQENINKK